MTPPDRFRPTRPRTLAALGLAVGLGLASCGGDDDSESSEPAPEASDPSDESETRSSGPEPDTASVTVDVEATTTSTTSTTTTTVPSRGASADDPAPVGDPEFDLVGYGNDATTDTGVLGAVSLPLGPDSTETGTCLAVVGVTTAVDVPELILPLAERPRVELMVGDDAQLTDLSECDDTPLRDAGYRPMIDANITEGTQFAFGEVYLLAEGTEPTSILLGRVGDPDSRFYEPTVLDALPPKPDLAVGPPPADLRNVDDPAAATVRVEGSISDSESTFDVTITGLTTTTPDELADDVTGQCVVVVGSLIGIDSVGAIVNALAVPTVSLLADGRIEPEAIGDCDETAVESAGYGSLTQAAVAPDNTYAFRSSFVVPDGANVEAIVLGAPDRSDSYWAFAPTTVDPIPPAPEREGINPEVDMVPAGTETNFDIEVFETRWTGSIDGLIEVGRNEEVVCYAVVGEIVGDGEDRISPNVGLIVDGVLWGAGLTAAFCQSDALDAAGYIDLFDAARDTSGNPVAFYERIFLPLDVGAPFAIAVGNAASTDNVAYIEPTVLTEIPPR